MGIDRLVSRLGFEVVNIYFSFLSLLNWYHFPLWGSLVLIRWGKGR